MSSSADALAAAAAGTNTAAGQHKNQSILSEKVARALQVRTDTPAMKAALDALSHLQPTTTGTAVIDAAGNNHNTAAADSTSNNRKSTAAASSTTMIVDSRSVRVAIEQDALQQALQLQNELKSLVDTVRDLREGIRETASIAHRVKQAIHANVIVTSDAASTVIATGGALDTSTSGEEGTGAQSGGEAADPAAALDPAAAGAENAASSSSQLNSFEQEQKLAAVLADAFAHRDAARARLEAVHAFLETFDLSQTDSRLLDHYNFEDVDGALSTGDASAVSMSCPNGMAFLKALERVRNIRQALGKTFGNSNDPQQSSSSLIAADTPSKRTGGLGASSALRMMEGLAQKQEKAYERLYHWLQKYLHAFATGSAGGSSSNPQVNDDHADERLDSSLQNEFVQRSLYTLRHVPAFYSHALELIASSRRTEETRRFLLALTSGYAGMPPLEMKSHDSVAYVGDMLAFCFQALATEADVTKGLLLYVPPEDEEQESKDQGEVKDSADDQERHEEQQGEDWLLAEDKPMTACDMLSMSMSGLARPLKSRVLQVLSTLSRNLDGDNNEGDNESDDGMDDAWDDVHGNVRNRLAHLFDICSLLLFYRSAIEKGIQKLHRQQMAHQQKSRGGGGDAILDTPSSSQHGLEPGDDASTNPLLACLDECVVEGTKAYEATIRVYCAMLEQLSSMTGDSEAHLAHSLLVLLADIRMSSPGFSRDVQCPSECHRTLSMEWVTETLTEAALATCKTLDDTVVLKQLVSVSKKASMGILAAERLDETIDRKEVELIEELVQTESSKVLDLCGLGSMAATWRRWQEQQQQQDDSTTADAILLMSTYPGLSPDQVETGMKEFYASLYSPPLPSLETVIKDPVLRKAARSKIAAKVCEIYADLYASIMSSGKGGYDDVSFLGHTPEQVKTLFSV